MANIKTLTREDIFRLLGEMDLEARSFDNGDIYTAFPADEEFSHDVVFTFDTDGSGWFGIQSFADEFDISEADMPRAMALINAFNMGARVPKAYIQNGRFKLEQWFMFDAPTSDDFIKEQIHLVMSMTWNFFTETTKIMK